MSKSSNDGGISSENIKGHFLHVKSSCKELLTKIEKSEQVGKTKSTVYKIKGKSIDFYRRKVYPLLSKGAVKGRDALNVMSAITKEQYMRLSKLYFKLKEQLLSRIKENVTPVLNKEKERMKKVSSQIVSRTKEKVSPVCSKIADKTAPVREKINNTKEQIYNKSPKLKAFAKVCKEKEIDRCCFAMAYESLALFVLIAVFSFSIGYSVYYNGEKVGAVTSKAQFENSLAAFVSEVEADTGEKIPTDLDVKFRLSVVNKDDINNHDAFRKGMLDAFPQYKDLAVLEIDGETVAAYENEQTILKLLDDIKFSHSSDDPTEVLEFADKVTVENRLCNVEYYKKPDEMKEFLQAPVQSATTHTVQEGETLYAIAPRYGMSIGEVTELNSGIDPALIHIGDVIMVSHEIPRLSIKSTRTVEFVQPVAFEEQKVEDASMYKNQKKITQKGVEGTEQVKAKVTTVDGAEVAREVLETKRVSDPIPQIVVVGTKKPPSTASTGSLRNPASGRITSRFGYRGREFHTGIDIAKCYGAPIYAADGGTVTFAGWNGGYGYCIKVSHGGGVSTLYAHCSKMYVSSGQRVSKGQHIAAMGSTGRSSGNHLHFEVRINGVPKNPTRYVSGIGR